MMQADTRDAHRSVKPPRVQALAGSATKETSERYAPQTGIYATGQNGIYVQPYGWHMRVYKKYIIYFTFHEGWA